MKNIMIVIGATVLLAVLLTSCASKENKTVFIKDSEKLAHDGRVPVGKIWKDPSAVMANYEKIIIADVRTDLQLERSWFERNGVRSLLGREDEDLKELAAYMKEAFSKSVRSRACRLSLTKENAADTVILEMAIVKVVANKPLLETGTTVGAAIVRPFTLFLIPVKSVVSQETKSPLCSYIAIEGKIKDSRTGKDLIYFVTDAHEEGALLDVNKHISPYANVREIIDRWSSRFVDVVNKRPLETGQAVKEEKKGALDYSLIKL